LCPGAILPRRLVADVLSVSAGQLGYPMISLVLVKAGDLLFHDKDTEGHAERYLRSEPNL
jgi:hypothetical protein